MRQWGLADHAAALGLELPPLAVDRLDALLQLLAKWNRVYNLTALRNESEWVSHHLLDSLSIIRLLPMGSLIDVGSGAGFPGLPVAIADPRREVVLLDSNSKKTAFLRQAVSELGLSRTTVQTTRVESFTPARHFDVVVSRAFSDLKTFVQCAQHLCSRNGRLMAMKGTYPAAELEQLQSGQIDAVHRLEVPLLDQQRHAVFLRPSAGPET